MVKHHLTNTKDKRYTVTLEYCGYSYPRFVARFCSEWINSAKTRSEAWIIAQEHYDNHKIDGVYNNTTASC